ncbi:hypothetical protein [Methanothermococcus sp.]|uniref:hypothetical protein n=1 Tax=Methanothermococcus sp. TaxID=2614238 RepID=UPI0025E2415A|nr:hypothetical protein [Methanothermococcus sp.]
MQLIKILTILGFLIILTSNFAFDTGNTATITGNNKIAILVSDNPADNMTVNNIASNINNSIIIHTKWGEYNQTVVSKIVAENPDMVLIVGGSMAVSDKYEEALDNLNMSFKRIYGKDRYETNEKVFNWINNHFKHALNHKKVIVVHGYLGNTHINIDNNSIVVLSNGSDLSVNSSELKEHNITDVIIVSGGVFINNNSLVVKRLENHGFHVKIHAIKNDVLKHIVEKKYVRLKIKTELMGMNESDDLNRIKILINNGEYAKAYKLEIELDEKIKIMKINGLGMYIKNSQHINHKVSSSHGSTNASFHNSVSVNSNINESHQTSIKVKVKAKAKISE